MPWLDTRPLLTLWKHPASEVYHEAPEEAETTVSASAEPTNNMNPIMNTDVSDRLGILCPLLRLPDGVQ